MDVHTYLVLSVLLVLGCVYLSAGYLENQLNYYEVLHHKDMVHHRSTRSLHDAPLSHFKERRMKLSTLGREFKLRMYPRRGLFTQDLKTLIVDANNQERSFDIDRDNFMEGFIEDSQSTSQVFAYFEHENLVATIRTKEDVYVIEPSWRHLDESDNYTMITYRASDMKKQLAEDMSHGVKSYCGYVHADHDDAAYKLPVNDMIVSDGHKTHTEPAQHRGKRAITKNSCTVMLVGDYKFFTSVGNSEYATAASYLVGEMSRVDALYRGIDFGDGYTGLGFEVKKVKIFEAATAVQTGKTHYNMAKDDWDTTNLLRAFSLDSDNSDVCLGHLWTSISFSTGVLGLGWIAAPNVNSAGGICSPVSGGYYYNTAWSSTLNKYGSRVLTQQADLVTAHEFGHNWGSQHDPASAECAPSSFSGGQYLMYTYSVSGYETNNNEFSPCSKRSISKVLENKLSSCFTEESNSFCGNYHVETPYEECDAGAEANDPCCGTDCKLKTGAVCSDANSLCCTNCQYAASSVKCREAQSANTTCEGDAFCTGTGDNCPDSTNRPDGSLCIDNGACQDGVCQSYCERFGLESCVCDDLASSCYYCCKNSSGSCFEYGSPPLNLADGIPCQRGYCDTGVCVRQIQDLTDRLWSIVTNLSFNAILEFMKKNLVLATILVSLFIYIPICLIVACVDYRNEKEDEDERSWHHKDNDKLYLDEDSSRIRQTYTRQRDPDAVANNSGSNRRLINGRNSNGRVTPTSVSRVQVAPLGM